MSFTPEELKSLTEKLGAEATKAASEAVEKANEAVNKGLAEKATKDEMKAAMDAQKEAVTKLTEIAEKQGLKISEIVQSLDSGSTKTYKSIDEVLKANEKDLKQIHENRVGAKEFMLGVTPKGEFYLIDHKAAGTNATINGVPAGSTATVTTQVSGSALLRAAATSEVNNLYADTPFIFNQVNLINTSFDKKQYSYWDELAPEGSAAIVAEGALKPLRQNHYELKTVNYKKVAVLLGFTEEFDIDFAALKDNIISTTKTHVLTKVQEDVVTDLIAKATAYNTSTQFGTVENVNEWDVIAAMAAQVESDTKGLAANVALMGTFKKYRMGTLKADNSGVWLNSPDILKSIKLQSTSLLDNNATADIIVGDLANYNVALRGGMIVRVGYNGVDFAENKFSVVIEQFYYNWISANRTKAIVKGKFDVIKAALTPTP